MVEPMRGRTGIGLLALLGVGAVGAAVYGLSWVSYRRLLDSPESFSPRRRGRADPSVWRIPGVSPAVSAVAQAQFRNVMRTVQGKMAMFFTPISVLFSGLVISRVGRPINLFGEHGSGPYGPLFAYAGATFALLAPQRFLLNVFATDGAGLTLSLISPISEKELVVGKSVGMGIVSSIPMLIITIIVMLIAPAAPIALWAAVFVAAFSSYFVFAPTGALLSAVFPKAANMNRMSSGSQPNGIASLIGLAVTALACGPPAVVAAMTFLLTKSPWLVLVAVLGYACIAAFLSFVLPAPRRGSSPPAARTSPSVSAGTLGLVGPRSARNRRERGRAAGRRRPPSPLPSPAKPLLERRRITSWEVTLWGSSARPASRPWDSWCSCRSCWSAL
jgi:hypothetical protein